MSDVRTRNRRRLTDLFVTGKEVVVSDSEDTNDAVTVWLSKISPLEQRDAAERAQAARAKVLVIKNSPTMSEARVQFEDQINDLGFNNRDGLISFLIAEDLGRREQSNEARLASEAPWGENGYLDSLEEAWENGGMKDRFYADSEDEEAKAIFDELKRFAEEVRAATDEDRKELAAAFDLISDADLKDQVVNKLIDAEGDFAWLDEYSRWQIFYAVRDPEDHNKRYFEAKEEVDRLQPEVFNKLVEEYRNLTVEAIEGKE